jgi:hypothetical protein
VEFAAAVGFDPIKIKKLQALQPQKFVYKLFF